MSWKSALKKSVLSSALAKTYEFMRPQFPLADVDWSRLVTLDFETYYDDEYTLKKMSTSEYVRDPRFKAQMVGIKIGNKPTKWYGAKKIKAALQVINWGTHSLLCHNTQFDGLILSHHYKIVPAYYYDSLSMARGLHSNEIGAGLDEVAKFYGGAGKIEGVLELTKGVLNWPADLEREVGGYCAQDVDETFRIFKAMHAKFPADEMALVHMTIRMFCDPVLRVDVERARKELERELKERRELFYSLFDPKPYYDDKTVLKSKTERAMVGEERDMLVFKRILGSNERFADMLRALGAEPPLKVSPAWMKRDKETREKTLDEKYTYAFAKDDRKFVDLPEDIDQWRGKLNPDKPADMKKILAIQDQLKRLVKARLMVKSTSNMTRAERFITMGETGLLLVAYAYYRAHTGRWGGNNKMNLQNLTRGGELRKCILAALSHVVCSVDSGQIEARMNAWLWGQTDLLEAFEIATRYETEQNKLPKEERKVARGNDRDAYCKFGDKVFGREITKDDFIERFVSKTCVLGLGFQMGAAKLQMTLAKGANGGPPVFFTLEECQRIVTTYRVHNNKIREGWDKCNKIIEDMALGVQGAWKCISWEKDTLWLPNGMSLKYPDLKRTINEDNGWEEWSYAVGETRAKIYGGLLCENIVQALARIVIGLQMIEIDKKYRVVMVTHDEIVAHPKKREADKCFDFMYRTMITPPSWCSDIPLAAEGGYDICYS